MKIISPRVIRVISAISSDFSNVANTSGSLSVTQLFNVWKSKLTAQFRELQRASIAFQLMMCLGPRLKALSISLWHWQKGQVDITKCTTWDERVLLCKQTLSWSNTQAEQWAADDRFNNPAACTLKVTDLESREQQNLGENPPSWPGSRTQLWPLISTWVPTGASGARKFTPLSHRPLRKHSASFWLLLPLWFTAPGKWVIQRDGCFMDGRGSLKRLNSYRSFGQINTFICMRTLASRPVLQPVSSGFLEFCFPDISQTGFLGP